MSDKNTKERSRFSKVCSALIDVFFIPIIVIAFICTILMFTAKRNNRVPTIFGNSIVTVLSDSMYPEYKVDDVLLIKKVSDLNSLKIGDNIAFYGPITTKNPLLTYEIDGEYFSKIIFHKIVRIIYAENEQGVKVRHFVCKGINTTRSHYELVEAGKGDYLYDSVNDEYYLPSTPAEKANANYVVKLEDMVAPEDESTWAQQIEDSQMIDMQYIRDEYVVGVYNGRVSSAIAGFIRFCTSPNGIIILVIVPASIMILLILFSMFKDYEASKDEANAGELETQLNLEKLKNANVPVDKDKKEKELDIDDDKKGKKKKERTIRRPLPNIKTSVDTPGQKVTPIVTPVEAKAEPQKEEVVKEEKQEAEKVENNATEPKTAKPNVEAKDVAAVGVAAVAAKPKTSKPKDTSKESKPIVDVTPNAQKDKTSDVTKTPEASAKPKAETKAPKSGPKEKLAEKPATAKADAKEKPTNPKATVASKPKVSAGELKPKAPVASKPKTNASSAKPKPSKVSKESDAQKPKANLGKSAAKAPTESKVKKPATSKAKSETKKPNVAGDDKPKIPAKAKPKVEPKA